MSLLFCWDRIVNRPQAVILLSSEPPAAREKSKIMQIYGKKEARLGWREEKGHPQRFYCILNYHKWNRNVRLVGYLSLCQHQKISVSGSHCSSNFCRTWWPDKNCSHCTPVSKWKRRSVNGLTSPCFCGTWNIFSIKIYPIFALLKFLCVTAKGPWQILNWSIILYCQASLAFHFILRLLWGTLF